MSEMEDKISKAIEVTKGSIPSKTQADDLQKVAQSILNLSTAKVSCMSCAGFETDEFDEEIDFLLTKKIRPHLDGTTLVQLTQAVLNLVTAKVTLLTGKPKPKKTGDQR